MLRSRMPLLSAALAAVAALAVVVVPTAVAAEGADAPADHPLLRQARENVEEVTARLDAARGDREAAATALQEVERRLASVEQTVNDAAAAVDRQELEVAAAAQDLESLRREVAALESSLERRSVAMYMRGADEGLAPLLASGGIQDVADRSSYTQLVVEGEDASLESAQAARTALLGAQERFDAESDRLERMEREQRELLAEVQELREVRVDALADARSEVDDLAALQDDLDEDVDRIADLIAEGTATAAVAMTPSSRGYSWPTCTRLTSNFGYRWGRMHKGIDLGGPSGTPIAAAKAGRVISTGYAGAYGNLTLVDHGDGVVTAYAHQSRIDVSSGEWVERGERIGLVGNTGRSTGPHLHFETRVNGVAVNPLGLLPPSC